MTDLLSKQEIRKIVKAAKAQLQETDKQIAANRVFETVEQLPEFISADKVLLYYSLPDELPTHAFINKWCDKKNIYLPRVNGDDLEILAFDRNKIHTGSFNIGEPDGSDLIDKNDIDLIIVPAIAFDCQGNRVGRGKGYYDRLLNGYNHSTVGVCYSFQLFEKVPTEAHDKTIDLVIADLHNTIRCK